MEFSATDIVIIGFLMLIMLTIVHIFLNFIIQPVLQLKKTIADILRTFSRYTYVIHYAKAIPPDLHSEVYEKLIKLANQLYTGMSLIPKFFFNFSFFPKMFSLPEEQMIYKSARNLTETANWINVKHKNKLNYIVKNIQTACDNLGLYIDPEDRITNKHLNL